MVHQPYGWPLYLMLLSMAWPVLGWVGASSHYHDYIVVGAGPSGLQLGYYMEQAGRDYLILEKGNTSGHFFTKYPRHDRLISINKRHTGKTNKEFNMRHDWNSLLSDDDSMLMKEYSREFFPPKSTLVKYLNDYQQRFGIKVQHNTEVRDVRQVESDSEEGNNLFYMEDQLGTTYSCRTLILATGISTPSQPQFEGFNLTIGYDEMPLDPEFYEGKSVLILGRGNSAFEVADSIYGHTNLIHMLARSRVRLAWATHYVGDLRAVNNGLLDTYQLKSLDGILEADVKHMIIKEKNGMKSVSFLDDASKFDNFAMRDQYDVVIRCLGFTFDHSIFSSETYHGDRSRTRKYPEIDHSYESLYLPGLFFLGTNTHSLDRRISSGGFIHGFRYTARTLFRLLEWRNHGVPWPVTRHATSDLLNVLSKRINEASGTYQMFGVLGDIIIFRNEGLEVDLYQEYPLKLLAQFEERTGHKAGPMIVLNLEYGANFSGPGNDVFHLERAIGEPSEAHKSNFLHPVLYYYEELPTEGEMMSLGRKQFLPRPKRLHAMVEDFLATWDAPTSHILPLRRYIENILQTDLRNFYVNRCLKLALLYRDLPESCNTGLLKGRGLVATPDMLAVSAESELYRKMK